MREFVASTLAVLAVAACDDPASRSDGEAAGVETAEVVARFGELTITASELDARVLSLPAAERPKPGEDLDAWYEQQVRQLVVEHRLYDQAEAAGLDGETTLGAARDEVEKRIAVGLCTSRLLRDSDPLGEAALRRAYGERAESLSLPERRDAYNLFLRFEPGTSRRAARTEIEALRERVLRGESFQRLAARHSDSESRHRNGSFGWVTPGQLPQALEAVLFSLDEGVPSEPVATRDGLHLFYVDQILPVREATFEEALPILREQLEAERREAALEALVAEIPVPPDALVLDREQLAALVEAGDAGALVLRVGSYRLKLAELRGHLRQTLAQQPPHERPPVTVELLWQQLEHLRRRELLYRHCMDAGEVPEEPFQERLADWRRQSMVALQRQRRLVDIAARDEGRLRLFYDNNLGRFSQPPMWSLRVLKVPLGTDPAARMAELEAAASSPGATLEGLQNDLGGQIEALDLETLGELSRTRPKLPPLVAGIEPPALTAPYRTDGGLEIAQVVARRDAEPLPFEEVRHQVATAYVGHYTQEVYAELSDEILRAEELHISPQGLRAARNAGLGRADAGSGVTPDVSVEQLEALLDEL